MRKKLALFCTCNFIQSKYTLDDLVEVAFPSVGMIDPLQRVLTLVNYEWTMSLNEEEVLMLLQAQSVSNPLGLRGWNEAMTQSQNLSFRILLTWS